MPFKAQLRGDEDVNRDLEKRGNRCSARVTSAPNVNFGTKSETKFGSKPFSAQKINFGTKYEFRPEDFVAQ